MGGRSEETREATSLETREPNPQVNDEERGFHGDEVLGKEQNCGGDPTRLLFLPQISSEKLTVHVIRIQCDLY